MSHHEAFPPRRQTLRHTPPGWVHPGCTFFVTICTQPREQNQLCRNEVAEIIFEAVAFRHETRRWHCRLVLLMPDHLHALVAFPPEAEMKKVVANFKEHVAKRTDIRWQRDFFDHRLRPGESLQQKAAYIRNNPVRAGLTKPGADWPFTWPR